MKNILIMFLTGIIFSCGSSSLEPQIQITAIEFEELNEKIYLKRETRGLNYNVSAVSRNPNKKLELGKDYLFTVDEGVFFYKPEGDTLFVRAYHQAKIPEFSEGKIKVDFQKLSKGEYYTFKNDYEEYGYKKYQVARNTPAGATSEEE